MKFLIALLSLVMLSPLAIATTPQQAAYELNQIADYHYKRRNENKSIMFNSIDKNWVERSIEYFKTAMKDKSSQTKAKQDLAAILGMFVNREIDDAIAFIQAHNSNSQNGSYLMMKKALPCFIENMKDKAEKAKKLGMTRDYLPLYHRAQDGIMGLTDFALKNALGKCVMWKNQQGEEVPPATFDEVREAFKEEKKKQKKNGRFGLGLFN